MTQSLLKRLENAVFMMCILFSGYPLISFACNGDQRLCEKRYNEVTFPTTHNAQSYIPTIPIPKPFLLLPFEWAKGLANRLNLNVNDQDLSLKLQLYKGVRAMKLRIMTVENTPYVCHGLTDGVKNRIENHFCKSLPFQAVRNSCGRSIASVDPCIVDPSATSLKDILIEIRDFLFQNPTELITLFFENYFDNLEVLSQEIKASGLGTLAYHQNTEKPWPKLKELIRTQKRLILFMNRESDGMGRKLENFPEFNSFHEFVWSSRYHFASVSELMSDDPFTNDLTSKAFLDRSLSPYNKLWVLQHFITPNIAGNPISASEVNRASILKARIEKYAKLLGSKPNFIWVDFFELPKDEPGYLDVVNQLNQR